MYNLYFNYIIIHYKILYMYNLSPEQNTNFLYILFNRFVLWVSVTFDFKMYASICKFSCNVKEQHIINSTLIRILIFKIAILSCEDIKNLNLYFLK